MRRKKAEFIDRKIHEYNSEDDEDSEVSGSVLPSTSANLLSVVCCYICCIVYTSSRTHPWMTCLLPLR